MKNKNDSLGNRMKQYEAVFNTKLPRRLPMVIRIDGKAFHSMVKRWHCEKPFDNLLIRAMQSTMRHLCENIQGAVFGYTQSDEISIVVRDDQNLTSEAFLDKRIQKICSVTASMATVYFNHEMYHTIIHESSLSEPLLKNFAFFDSRCFILPEHEVINYLIWRQQDASRNSIQMLAQSMFSHKELQNKNSNQLQEMCWQKGTNWNNIETCRKRGTCIYKVPTTISTDNGEIVRNKWQLNEEFPIFTEAREFLDQILKGEINDN